MLLLHACLRPLTLVSMAGGENSARLTAILSGTLGHSLWHSLRQINWAGFPVERLRNDAMPGLPVPAGRLPAPGVGHCVWRLHALPAVDRFARVDNLFEASYQEAP